MMKMMMMGGKRMKMIIGLIKKYIQYETLK